MTKQSEKSKFQVLSELDLAGKTAKLKVYGQNDLNYLSWSTAWSLFKKHHPEATYEVVKNENGLPYFSDPKTGVMVYTKVTANQETHEMWLPVMNGANKAVKEEKYAYYVKEYKDKRPTGGMTEKYVEQCDMFLINKALMRCLTKNIAMFGLGLYIYEKEDFPDVEPTEPDSITTAQSQEIKERLTAINADTKEYLNQVAKGSEVTFNSVDSIYANFYERAYKILEKLELDAKPLIEKILTSVESTKTIVEFNKIKDKALDRLKDLTADEQKQVNDVITHRMALLSQGDVKNV